MSEAQGPGGTFASGSTKGISYIQSSSTTGLYKETYRKKEDLRSLIPVSLSPEHAITRGQIVPY